MTLNFVVIDNVLLPICCHIGSGMLIFGEESVALSAEGRGGGYSDIFIHT